MIKNIFYKKRIVVFLSMIFAVLFSLLFLNGCGAIKRPYLSDFYEKNNPSYCDYYLPTAFEYKNLSWNPDVLFFDTSLSLEDMTAIINDTSNDKHDKIDGYTLDVVDNATMFDIDGQKSIYVLVRFDYKSTSIYCNYIIIHYRDEGVTRFALLNTSSKLSDSEGRYIEYYNLPIFAFYQPIEFGVLNRVVKINTKIDIVYSFDDFVNHYSRTAIQNDFIIDKINKIIYLTHNDRMLQMNYYDVSDRYNQVEFTTPSF